MKTFPYALLAEDDDNSVHLFLAILARYDASLKTVHVANGEEALEYLQRRGRFKNRTPQLPAVVFLDLEMPHRNGIEVLEAMKSDEHLRGIPVVIIAGTPNEAKMRRCYELGANSYVVKPVDFRRFSSFVTNLASFWLTLNEPPP
ncbi:MAG TPA: response regulator [Opitutaceae bacterium]|nr:response regulator [Opitutaceae bacterium]